MLRKSSVAGVVLMLLNVLFVVISFQNAASAAPLAVPRLGPGDNPPSLSSKLSDCEAEREACQDRCTSSENKRNKCYEACDRLGDKMPDGCKSNCDSHFQEKNACDRGCDRAWRKCSESK